MRSTTRIAFAFAAALALAYTPLASAQAQQAQPAQPTQQPPARPAPKNLEKLKQFRVSGTDLDIPTVPQSGPQADQIRANLKFVKLPPGFKIDLYALVPDARMMAPAPSTNMLFVGTRKTRVWAVTDRTSDGRADEVKPFAPSLNFKVPNGVCWTKDGFLIVVEHNRILNFPAAEFFYEGPDVAVIEVVGQGKLVPEEEESFNHGARVCRVGPDNKLYVSLGQPFNVPEKSKVDLYSQWGIGGIIRLNAFDGSGREVYARGIRNSVGIDFNPKNGELWFTDNQVDGMGDDMPPGELNRIVKPASHFGFPWYGGGKVRTAEYKDSNPPAGIVFPEAEMSPHAADLGLTFYTGKMFPAKYQGGIFDAQHGSWNRSTPVGARVMFTPVNANGGAGKPEVFAEGWLDPATKQYRGRPADVAPLRDGSLLVSDDFAGAIYRITYAGE
jgi:glucose/arabinose dehydrogenase